MKSSTSILQSTLLPPAQETTKHSKCSSFLLEPFTLVQLSDCWLFHTPIQLEVELSVSESKILCSMMSWLTLMLTRLSTSSVHTFIQMLQQTESKYSLIMFVVMLLNLLSHLLFLPIAICLSSMKSELKPQDNNGQVTSSLPKCLQIINNSLESLPR